VTVRQVDALPLGPSPNGGELAGAPDEATGDPTGVVAVGHLVTGGDDVVEAHRFSEGGHHVLGSRGGEHQLAPRPAVLRQDVERKGATRARSSPLPVQRPFGPQPGTSPWRRAPPPGRGPSTPGSRRNGHRPDRGPPGRGGTAPGPPRLARANAALSTLPLAWRSSVRSRSMKAAPTTEGYRHGADESNRAPGLRQRGDFGPGRVKGPPGGVGDPFTRTS